MEPGTTAPAIIEVPEIMRGDFVSCFEHYLYRLAQVPRATHQAQLVKEPIADFCGCTTNTVARWMRGFTPVGDVFLRLQCLLDAVGYRVVELERMKPEPRGMIELIGYKVLSVAELVQATKYANTDALFAAIRTPHPDDQTRLRMFEALIPRKEALEATKKKAVEHLIRTAMYKALVRPLTTKPEPHERAKAHGLPSRPGLLSIVEGLHALLGEVSDEEILDEMAHSKVDRELIFKLSSRLAGIRAKAKKAVKNVTPIQDSRS